MNKHFRKIACVAALSLMPMVAFADDGVGGDSGNGSGLFLGLDTGYSFNFIREQREQSVVSTITSTSTASAISGANIGVKAGYNFYFTQMFGVRGYLDYTFMFAPSGYVAEYGQQTQKSSGFSSAHLITLNADLLVNIMQTDSVAFGAFVGIGLGYGGANATRTSVNGTTTELLKAGGFLLPINVGLSLTANNHHRFELGFKIPTLGITPTLVDGKAIPAGTKVNIRYFTTSVGYSYIF